MSCPVNIAHSSTTLQVHAQAHHTSSSPSLSSLSSAPPSPTTQPLILSRLEIHHLHKSINMLLDLIPPPYVPSRSSPSPLSANPLLFPAVLTLLSNVLYRLFEQGGWVSGRGLEGADGDEIAGKGIGMGSGMETRFLKLAWSYLVASAALEDSHRVEPCSLMSKNQSFTALAAVGSAKKKKGLQDRTQLKEVTKMIIRQTVKAGSGNLDPFFFSMLTGLLLNGDMAAEYPKAGSDGTGRASEKALADVFGGQGTLGSKEMVEIVSSWMDARAGMPSPAGVCGVGTATDAVVDNQTEKVSGEPAHWQVQTKNRDLRHWIPLAVDAVMRAYRKEEDLEGVRRWFEAYRILSQLNREVGAAGAAEKGVGSLALAQPTRSRRQKKENAVRVWPYLTMLHASHEARVRARGSPPSGRPMPISPQSTPFMAPPPSCDSQKIIMAIVRDGLRVPVEAYALCLHQAMYIKDWRQGRKLWVLLRNGLLGPSTPGGDQVLIKFNKGGRAKRCLDSVVVALRFMSSPGWSIAMAKEHGVRQHVRALMHVGGLSSLGADGWNYKISLSPGARTEILTLVISAALGQKMMDPALALWAIEKFDDWKIGVDERAIDAVAHGVLGYAVQGKSGNVWARYVLGKEFMERKREVDLKTSLRLERRGLNRPMAGLTRTTLEDWDDVSWRIYELSRAVTNTKQALSVDADLAGDNGVIGMDKMVYLPISRPFARLQPNTKPFSEDTLFSAHVQTYDYRFWKDEAKAEAYHREMAGLKEGVKELLRRCIQAQSLVEGADGGVLDWESEMEKLELEMDR